MKSLILNEIEISTDEEGRFSLNDLHKAAGGHSKHVPNKFMRSESFKNVVDVLNAQNRSFEAVIRKAGRYTGGTWVCRELVYKYAMWVSAEFEVQVIQTFDAVTNRMNGSSVMDALNELSKKIEHDKELASKCGQILSNYKKVSKENEDQFKIEVDKAQLTLGFTKGGEA
jgi:hypothetical protein